MVSRQRPTLKDNYFQKIPQKARTFVIQTASQAVEVIVRRGLRVTDLILLRFGNCGNPGSGRADFSHKSCSFSLLLRVIAGGVLMSMNSQVNVSNVQRQSSLVRGIDGAHRMTPSKHSYHAKRSSDPARFMMGRDLGCESTGTAGSCSVNEQLPRPLASEQLTTLVRPAGDPPAAIWAALVISNALSS